MKKLLYLFICTLISDLRKIDASAVQWPSGYSVDWEVVDESTGYSAVVKEYRSEEEEAYRWDVFGGENTFILKCKDPKTSGLYYYFPETVGTTDNVMNCYFIPLPPMKNITSYPSGLPNTKGFTKSRMVSINGAQVREWTRKNNYHGLVTDDTLWINMGTKTEGPIPIKAHYMNYLGNDDEAFIAATRLTVLYYNYIPQEPEKLIWEGLKNVECHIPQRKEIRQIVLDNFDGIAAKGSFRASTISEHASVTAKKFKGLKRSGSSVDSALPFPYTDDEVRDMAAALPKSLDWRLRGAVTEVKNQMSCGSCWAFGTVGAMEGSYFLKTGILTDMSEQALMDCGWTHDSKHNTTNGGCLGNSPQHAFDWIKNHGGLPLTIDYGNYRQMNGRCKMNNIKPVAPIQGFVHVPKNINAVKAALYHHGPLTVSISTPLHFFFYTHGVFHHSHPGPIDHSVLLIGYGSLEGDEYWIIKNSWGEKWGLRGCGLISTANNTLGLLDDVLYPLLE